MQLGLAQVGLGPAPSRWKEALFKQRQLWDVLLL